MGKDYRIPAFGPYVTLAKHKYSTQRRPLVIVGRNDGLQRFSLSVKANDQALFLSDVRRHWWGCCWKCLAMYFGTWSDFRSSGSAYLRHILLPRNPKNSSELDCLLQAVSRVFRLVNLIHYLQTECVAVFQGERTPLSKSAKFQ